MRLTPVDDPSLPSYQLKRCSSNESSWQVTPASRDLEFCRAARAAFRAHPSLAVAALGEMAARIFRPVVKGTAPAQLLRLHPSEQELFSQRAFSWGRAPAPGRGRRDRDDSSEPTDDSDSDSGEELEYRSPEVPAPVSAAAKPAAEASGGKAAVGEEKSRGGEGQEEDDGRNTFSWAMPLEPIRSGDSLTPF